MQIKLSLDGKKVRAFEGETILQLAKRQGVDIPTLCYHPDLKPEGRCRICLVEVDGKLMTSCNTEVKDGMNILTKTERVLNARKLNGELIFSNSEAEHDLEITKVLKELGIEKSRFSEKPEHCPRKAPLEKIAKKCILCGRCVQACSKIQSVENISFVGRGICTEVGTPYNIPMSESPCTFCAQCALYCPTTALRERAVNEKLVKDLESMKDLINRKKYFIVQTAPSIRVSLGELFGMKPGTLVTGKMVAALRKLGFDKVFDTNFAADLTIMEEASEFLKRFKENKNLPLITSCCPAWIIFAEENYPWILKNISTCKSPQQMFGAVVNSYYAKILGKPRKDIFVVSVMPCVAKKFEAQRPEMLLKSGEPDVDLVLTTRELARLLKDRNIDLSSLKEEEFDSPLGVSSGGAAIFGATGGVMEAALRVACEALTGKTLKKIDFKQIRGLDGMRDAEVIIGKKRIKIAIVNSLKNVREFIDSGKWKKYHFIEIMACPGGCIGGGGQPRPTTNEIRLKRMEAIYRRDGEMKIRLSSHNPAIKDIYKNFLGEPLGEKSEEILHTKYKEKKPRYF